MNTVFHTAPPPWFESVKDLRPGGSRRISDAIKVSFNGRAYHHWNFREKIGEVYEPQLSLPQKLEIIRLMRETEDKAIQSHELPLPIQAHPQDWPSVARVWMHKAGLNNLDITAMGAYWNARLHRVVLPFTGLDGTRSWVARRIEGDNGKSQTESPKYIFPRDTKRGGGALVTDGEEYRDGLVIVEDLLSAHRIVRDTSQHAVAALGTSLDREAITKIAAAYTAVSVWLDPDYYGQLGARKIIRQLGQVGIDARNIVSDVDPKNLDVTDLVAALRSPRN